MLKFHDHKANVSFLYPEGWLPARLPLQESQNVVLSIVKPTTPTGEIRDATFHANISITIRHDSKQTLRDAMRDYLRVVSGGKDFEITVQTDDEVQFTYTTLDSLEHVDAKEINVVCKRRFLKRDGKVVELEVDASPTEFDEVSHVAEAVLTSLTFC